MKRKDHAILLSDGMISKMEGAEEVRIQFIAGLCR